jgi:hydroxymethylpyrimidine/phosphomethylpyrimidine kinase
MPVKTYPVVLSIAGSDSGGGAGIQADVKTISALGGFAATAITAITVQNTLGVQAVDAVAPHTLEAQIDAVMSDLPVAAVKIGMIGGIENVLAIARMLRKYKPRFVVLDPVMTATGGDVLIEKDTAEEMRKVLFPLANLITPNVEEAEILVGYAVDSEPKMVSAAKDLLHYGSQAVLVKGGHLQQNTKTDILQCRNSNRCHRFTHETVVTKNLHGTGCSLSSAIATLLAREKGNIHTAVKEGIIYVHQAIEAGKDIFIGHGNGAIQHFFAPRRIQIQALDSLNAE